MAAIADERLDRLAEVVRAKKVTPASVRVVDVPGTGAQLLGNLRQVDALLVVLDAFTGTRDPVADLETLTLELLVADRDHVERRLERVGKQAKSGDAKVRAEAEELERLLGHLDEGKALADWPGELPRELEPLTTKPTAHARERARRHRPRAGGRARRAVRRGGGGVPRGAALGARRGDEAAGRRARPDHLLHRGREGDPRVDAAPGRDGPRRRGDDPQRHRARLHPLPR